MCLILHLTDSHLFSDGQSLLKGVNPLHSFSTVLSAAYAACPEPDLIILGGDMAQDESAAAYQMLAELLREQGWRAPVMISPGNHASLERLQRYLIPALDRQMGYADTLTFGRWNIATLTTHQSGYVAGKLASDELNRLAGLLQRQQEQYLLLAMHHPPVKIGSGWLDAIRLSNSQGFWDTIADAPQLKGVLCGHIHQHYDRMHGEIRVLGTPSTCVQFKPEEDAFQLDNISPGYRWLRLQHDGSIETGVQRITGFIPEDLENKDPY